MANYYELDGRGMGKAVRRPDTLGNTPNWVLAYGIISALAAIVLTAASLSGASPGEGSSITQEQADAAMLWWPVAAWISAATGIAAGILGRKRRCWGACIGCMAVCVLAAVLYSAPAAEMIVLSVILAAVGLLMTIRVNANRDAFDSRRAPREMTAYAGGEDTWESQ